MAVNQSNINIVFFYVYPNRIISSSIHSIILEIKTTIEIFDKCFINGYMRL